MFTDSTKYGCMVTNISILSLMIKKSIKFLIKYFSVSEFSLGHVHVNRERINPSLPSWMAGATNNTKEKVLVAWNTEFRVSVEVIFFSSLVQQCLEKWVIQ